MAEESNLLFKIVGDPEGAEKNIRKFQESFRRSSSAMRPGGAKRAMANGMGSMGMIAGLEEFTRRTRANFEQLNEMFRQHQEVADTWRAHVTSAFQQVLGVSRPVQMQMLDGFTRFDTALARNATTALVYGQNIGVAMVKAIFETAEGFAMLAVGDFHGAALAFESAALFGAVGAAVMAVGAAIPGGKGGHGAASPYGRAGGAGRSRGGHGGGSGYEDQFGGGSGDFAPGLAPGAAAAQPAIILNFHGPVYGGKAGAAEMAGHISDAVESGAATLVATRSQQGSPVGH